MSRRFIGLSLLSGALGIAAVGCNLLVGVGDYTAGGQSSEGSGDDATGDDAEVVGTTDSAVEAGPGVDGGVDGYVAASEGGPDTGAGEGGEGGPVSHTCAVDPSITSCASGALDAGAVQAYSCSGSDTPQQDFSGLACVPLSGTVGAGSVYCCAQSSCQVDSTVTGCASGATGYSCSGVGTPAQSAPTPLACVAGSGGAGSAVPYCCAPSTCAVSANVTCASGSAGYACTGSDTPSEAFPYLTCTSTSNGYCCASAPACATNSDCFGDTTVCDVLTATCQPETGIIGDPCSTPQSSSYWAACAGGAISCNGTWCATTSCTTDSDCGRNSAGEPNYCVSAGTGNSCFPGCSTNDDCGVFTNATYDTFCVPAGTGTSVCSVSNGGIGDPCSYDSDCTTGYCGDSYACATTCSSPSDTSCGSNSLGAANICAYDDFEGDYECTPACATDSDCIPYGGGAGSCVSVSGGYACEP